MSRIGKKPVEMPEKVSVAVSGGTVTVEGPLGTLSMRHRPEVGVEVDESAREVRCSIDPAKESVRQIRAYWGLTRSLVAGMVEGVSKGFQRTLEVVGVGYTAAVQGNQLTLTVGYAHPVSVPIPPGLEVTVQRQTITVKGPDKQQVGQFAADVRAVRPPEPYQGKGIKYADETVRRKEGKQFGA